MGARALRRPDLRRLTPAEREELRELAELQYGGESFRDFLARVAPHEPPPRHLSALIRALERARRQPIRLCISMPPRHAKTMTILRGIAWWLARTPADTNAYCTHGADLANSKSRIARALTELAGVRMSKDSSAVHEWRTAAGGGLLATGSGGPLTGQGVTGIAVVDDPFKNREEADSPTIREKVWEWFNEVVMTRLERASCIVVHTRWHEDDLIGRLEAQGDWEVIRLPAIAEEGDTLGRQPGEALWPERFPTEPHERAAAVLGSAPGQLGTLRGQLGEFSFAALYQQRPRPRGSALFGPPSYFDPAPGGQPFDLTGWQLVIGADPAASKQTSADWSVAVVLAYRRVPAQLQGLLPETEFRVLDVYRKQVSIPEFARALRALQNHYGLCPVYVEAVAGFKAVPDLLREQDSRLEVVEAPVKGDKFQRAQNAAAAWNAVPSRLLVPLNAPVWLADFLFELKRFTGVGDAHDDQVDALSHAVNAAITEPEPVSVDVPDSIMTRRS